MNLLGHQLRREHAEWMTLGAVMLIGCLLSIYAVLSERSLIASSELNRLHGQARIVDENLHHQLVGVRNALESLRQAMRESEIREGPLSIESLRGAMPGVRALVLLDAEGKILQSSDSLRDVQLDDHAFLESIHRMKDEQVLYVSRPYENSPGIFNIKLSMVMSGALGQPAGVVTAILNPGYFDVVLRSVLYAQDMRCSIVQQDGLPVLLLGAGHVDASLGADEDRLGVLRTINPQGLRLDKPLAVAVSRSRSAINRPWVNLAVVYGFVWTGFALLTSWSLVYAQRRRAAFFDLGMRQRAERAEHAQRLELALAGAQLGLWEQTFPSGMLRVDKRAAAMLGYAPEEQAASSVQWRGQIHPDDIADVDGALEAHLQGDCPTYESEHRLRHRDGHWVWVQCRGQVLERNALGVARKVVGTRMDISARKLHEEEIERLAFYDGLTGLPNRRLLMDRLNCAVAGARRTCQHGAVIFIDLDNFKDLNDTLGHDMGDKLLTLVSARLSEVTRTSDTVARLGGDEFVVMLERLGTSPFEAYVLAERLALKIVKNLAGPHYLQGHQIYSTPSIGVALFGESSDSVDEVLKQADLAMYEAKGAGRNTVRFFEPQMQTVATVAAELEADLRFALARSELLLHYQPIVDKGRRVVAVEALIRWQHPRHGLVSPAQFIPLAEKTGLILPIGEWVLQTACQQLSSWALCPETRHLTASINVSPRQLRQAEFVPQVKDILQRTGANPKNLKLELTEGMLLNDVEEVIGKMNALKAMGVGFSLDDFGTGYSSLSYLKRLPLDQLKIDQSFVKEVMTNTSDATIAKAIIALAHSLGLDVVAEGVETEAQRAFLAQHECDAFQGYLFARPASAQDIEAMLPLQPVAVFKLGGLLLLPMGKAQERRNAKEYVADEPEHEH